MGHHTLETAPVLEVVWEAVERHGVPAIINSDQGSQFTSDDYKELLKSLHIWQSMDGKSRWADNIMMTQIQPHFLYNSLTVIQELCRSDPAQAEAATVQFANYLRGNMDALQTNTPIPFGQELEHTREYLALEQMRFEDKLTVRYDIQCADFALPILTLQPIVENAVRHGVRGNTDGRGEVVISTREQPDRYEITVSDNGPGFDPKAQGADQDHSHVGIQNVRQRLSQMCGGTLTLESAPGEGTRVTIALPKEANQR